MTYEELKLSNQLCFPVYAASRLIIREYQPYLDKLGITYPQYLVMMVLWEEKKLTVKEITNRLVLNTNTVTPLLQRMEKQNLLIRKKSTEDTRVVYVSLTKKGEALKEKAVRIPQKLSEKLMKGPFSVEELINLKQNLTSMIEFLSTHT